MEYNKIMEENYNEVKEENAKNKTPEKSKKKINVKVIVIVTIILAVIAAGVAGALAIKSKNEQEQLDIYYNNLEEVSYMILSGAADSEELGNLIVNVWSNSIYKREDDATDIYSMENGVFLEDFNDALENLFDSDEYAEQVQKVEDDKDSVTELMKILINPPKEYEKTYSLLEKYYESYLKLANHVVNAQGSLNDFANEFEELDDEVVGYYEKIKLHLK